MNDDNKILNINGDFFIEDGALIQHTGNDKNIIIPEGVTSITPSAFSNFSSDDVFTISMLLICFIALC